MLVQLTVVLLLVCVCMDGFGEFWGIWGIFKIGQFFFQKKPT